MKNENKNVSRAISLRCYKKQSVFALGSVATASTIAGMASQMHGFGMELGCSIAFAGGAVLTTAPKMAIAVTEYMQNEHDQPLLKAINKQFTAVALSALAGAVSGGLISHMIENKKQISESQENTWVVPAQQPAQQAAYKIPAYNYGAF